MSLEPILENSREEDSQRYLADHPEILLATLGRSAYYNCLIPKFKFGNEYVSDFVFIEQGSFTADSPWIFIYLIELEPPTSAPFTKAGVYAKRLNGAIAQVTDWMGWIRSNDAYFRNSLSKAMQSDAAFHAPGFDCRRLASYLERSEVRIDPNPRPFWTDSQSTAFQTTSLLINAKIVIGRRSMFTVEDNKRRASLFVESQQRFELIPYDRLLDAERFLAAAKSEQDCFNPEEDGRVHPSEKSGGESES